MLNRCFVAILFFVSGVCGLIYEVLWIRLFSFILGNTYFSISIIIASFMFGLFIGSYLIRRYILKNINTLVWYGVIEIFVGLFAALLVIAFPAIENIYQIIYKILGQYEVIHKLTNLVVTFTIISIPTIAMGATLPLVIQFYNKKKNLFAKDLSNLYSINTIGGALGVFVAGFYLIEFVGIKAGIIVAATLNITIGIVITMFLSKEIKFVSLFKKKNIEEKESSKLTKIPFSREQILYLTATGLTGFSALALEIIWIRGLKFLIQSNTYSLSIILITFLVGIAVGSRYYAKISNSEKISTYLVGIFQLLLGVYAIFTIYLIYNFMYTDFVQNNIVNIIYDYSYNWVWSIPIFIVVCMITFLIPTITMGALFPLINKLFQNNKKAQSKAGVIVSSTYAANTIGAILGSLTAGFILLPLFGVKSSIYIITSINFLLGIIFIFKSKQKLIPSLSFALIAVFIVVNLSFGNNYLKGWGEKKGRQVTFYEEGLMATVSVTKDRNTQYMCIDGMVIASTSWKLLQKERLIAHLPFFFKPDIEQVLSVGLASGISIGSMALHNSVEKIDCVELIKPVFTAAQKFNKYNGNIFNNSKIRFFHNDIYAFMKYSDKKYDLISSDGKLGALNSANTIMLAADYFDLCREKLTPGGIFIHWVPIITPTSALKIIMKTLSESFTHVTVLYYYPGDIFMLASDQPITFEKKRIAKVFEDQSVQQELQKFYITDPLDIISSFVGNYRKGQDQTSAINTFDRPVLEFDFLRDFKKSRKWKGGYYARKMSLLINQLKRNLSQNTSDWMIDIDPIHYRENICKPSLDFYNFVLKNYQPGNFKRGLSEYINFKKILYGKQ